ncbi:MAG: hypothetical protein K0S28_1248 [Paucimonas sp.]|jgi:diguanylate cyclase (GGDEF)-like protein/PAS domain S-box-containing protein|nr:hypothetical protein [Paucimonas sp.]
MADIPPLLLQQLAILGLDPAGPPPGAQQWERLLAEVARTYKEQATQRETLEQSQRASSQEVEELYQRIEESQRIAGLGNWSFDRINGKGHWSKECFHIFGLESSIRMPTYRELSKRVHRDDRIDLKDRVEAAVHDGKNFEIEFRYLLPDNETRWLRVNGHPIRDVNRIVVRLNGTVMDVTGRKVTELRQSMEHTITRLLAESETPEEVMPEVIQTICETLDWTCGAFWTLDPRSDVMKRQATWYVPETRVEEFFRKTRNEIASPADLRLLHQALKASEPIWAADIAADNSFHRSQAAQEAHLHAALAFPIKARGQIFGIMEFFNSQPRQPDHEMMQSAHFIGRHIGQFLQRKQAEEALRESEAHFRSLVEQASDSFYVHDIEGNFLDVNQHGCDCLGYARSELLALSLADIDLDLSVPELRFLSDQMSARGPIALESRYRRKDGSVFPVEIRMGPIEIKGQRQLLSLVRDVTERKELQDHIQHLAYHDPLTGIPNRAMFNRQLSQAILRAQREKKGIAVLFIDLDRFKNINDTLGHDAGDRLLQEMARRIKSCLRTGRPGSGTDMVARLGGDEFVVLIEDLTDPARVSHVARKILATMVKEFPLDGQMIHVTASIGVSTFPEDGRNEFSLMKHADIAMYRAKDRGKNNFQFYSTHMDLHSADLLALESGLRRALDRNEFLLLYQTKVDANTRRITGVEALVRWQHPELGLVSPVHFIPIAEESGLIVPLSQWVLNEACRQSKKWQEQGLPPMRIAVNLSARQFFDDNLFAITKQTLRDQSMDASLLEFEITESMMMHNADKSAHVLSELRKLGVRVAVDDFGVGYSSLSHLKQFPIDIIKIDRSFIKDIPGDKADEAITEAIIALGKSLQITVVAEGVETGRQLQFLRDRGCHQIQGYYFSMPVHAEQVAKLLRKQLADIDLA